MTGILSVVFMGIVGLVRPSQREAAECPTCHTSSLEMEAGEFCLKMSVQSWKLEVCWAHSFSWTPIGSMSFIPRAARPSTPCCLARRPGLAELVLPGRCLGLGSSKTAWSLVHVR